MQRIDAAAWRGFAFIEWWELNSWYGAERISKSVWRDLRDRFSETTDGAELQYIERPDGVMLVNSRHIRSISAKTGDSE
jgi:hypothetical protein